MDQSSILQKLEQIVGKEYISNRIEELYIYSRDPGASVPRNVDFVVLPQNVEEIQKIVKLANEMKIPIVPMGGGLTLSGLVLPIKGGIVLDMKRMDKIIEVNKLSRYVIVEPGVTSGKLQAFLERNFPTLQISIPDAPPSVTVVGNVLINGSGFLSQNYGDHSSMINGLEVVLPNGELCKLGSCAISDYWFTRGPIPDLIGLFTSSFGTMGIVTKVSVKLFPKPKMRDIVFGLIKNSKDIVQLISDVTYKELAEDILLGKQDRPDWMKGYIFIIVYITGDSQEELNVKTKILKKIFRNGNARYMKAPDNIKYHFLLKPQFAASAADFRKGGGFEYVGSFMPLEKIPEAIDRSYKISNEHNIVPTIGCRIIDKAHNILIFITYPFNRADPKDIENARDALEKTNILTLELGGIPWKAELNAQKMIINKMDANYKKLFSSIRNVLDPNGIMNPGNWEVN